MATSALPTSNIAGNNQTSPGVSMGVLPTSAPNPMLIPMSTAGSMPSANPYMSAAPTSSTMMPHSPSIQDNLNKQWIDILGKGTGGTMASLYGGMGGTASDIFKQFLAGQVPVQAQQTAALNQGLAEMGVSGNSSVAGLANANLAAGFNATAAEENARLMTQNQQDQMSMLQNMQQLSSAEVSQSPWDIFSQVVGTLGSVAGSVMGGGGGGGGGLLSGFSNMFKGGGGGSGFMPNATVDQSYMDPALALPTSIG